MRHPIAFYTCSAAYFQLFRRVMLSSRLKACSFANVVRCQAVSLRKRTSSIYRKISGQCCRGIFFASTKSCTPSGAPRQCSLDEDPDDVTRLPQSHLSERIFLWADARCSRQSETLPVRRRCTEAPVNSFGIWTCDNALFEHIL